MTIKKFNYFLLQTFIEQWLTEMSRKGLHFKKYKSGMYYFDENSHESYIYQIDFREGDNDYFELYKDAGWQYVDSFIDRFHYFRTKASNLGLKKIYSDRESVKETMLRMMNFYMMMFVLMIVAQVGLIATWQGHVTSSNSSCNCRTRFSALSVSFLFSEAEE